MTMKFNPFRPNDIIHAGMFVGRLDEIKVIDRCMFQTRHGSPQHFLVQGERGIGKSSLLFYVEYMADGSVTARSGNKYNFLTVHTDLGGCSTQTDVIGKLGRGFRTALGKRRHLREKAKGVWEWITNWEVLGVQYHKGDKVISNEEIAESFVDNISTFCSESSGDIDGILFLIDEADGPPSEAGLGSYLKMVTERFSRADCNKVLFGLAGLPSLLYKLRDSHESSPRLFETMKLEPLEKSERRTVIEIGIEDANKKNTIQTSITDDATDFLADLSEGYPHFLQQFAFSAFENDTDNEIDVFDVSEGAFREGGALSQLGDKFFSEMYHARVASEDYRRVLDAMAEHGDSWIERKKIIAESGVSQTSVTNALQALKTKQVIIQDDTRRGFYKLPTNSFAAWINAIRAARAQADAARKGAHFEG